MSGNGIPPSCSPSERPTKLPHKSKSIISPELTNNLPENVRCVDIIKQILAKDFRDYLKNRTNKYANEKIVFDEPCTSTSTSNKALELQWFDTTADELQAYIALCILQSQVKRHSSVILEHPEKYRTPLFLISDILETIFPPQPISTLC
jgi:hypothetical protein